MLPRYYEDPHALHIGTMPNRAYYIPFDSRQAAAADERSAAPAFHLLSGEWQFEYFESIRLLPEDVASAVCTKTIPVPSVWQNHGYDRHQYTNIQYPFPYDPPYVPKDNPCGLYRRCFEYVPAKENERLLIDFEGVDAAFYLYINGEMAGYSQVPHCTSEFDITSLVHPGLNTVTVLVLKWCDGSYFDDQDKFRTSGIFRDVYLLTRPENHLRDYFVHADLSDDFATGTLKIDTEFFGTAQSVACTLYAPDGQEIAAFTADDTITVTAPVLWNAEAPALYTLYLECAGEVIMEKVGFRRIEVKDGVVYLNGQNIKFRGVNRHDSDPVLGPAVGVEEMKTDLLLMKMHNINAIRTSHYPNSPLFPRLCDEMGFYLIDEADMECHGVVYCGEGNYETNYNILACDPEYQETFVDRVALLISRDKNRPCVVIWSMGNESGYGENIAAGLLYAKTMDPSRLTHYERASFPPEGMEIPGEILDLYSRMYASIEEIDRYYEEKQCDKPYILCEYIHAMGNGPGDAEDYFRCIQRHDGFCGGFVWEWCDHAVLWGRTNDGKPRYLYGGDFGEFPHDVNFCMDGLVYPDRTPHTGLLEFKNVNRPVRFEAKDISSGVFSLRSYLDFVSPDSYLTARAWCEKNGVRVCELTLPANLLNVAPHAQKEFTVSYPETLTGPFAVVFELSLAHSTFFGPAGYPMGMDQVGEAVLEEETAKEIVGDISAEETAASIILTGSDFRYVFSKDSGCFDSIIYRNRALLTRPMAFNIWRAPTDNDRYIVNEWRMHGFDRAMTRTYGAEISTGTSCVTLTVPFSLGALSRAAFVEGEAVWTVNAAGEISLSLTAHTKPGRPALPRFGLRLFMPAEFNQAEYFGFGPYESYCDKHRASRKSRFVSSVAGLHEDYIKPQENGSHFDCDLLCLAAPAASLTVSGKGFSFNASPYTQEELTEKAHNFELTPCGETVLCIDAGQSGIGSNSCGPALLKEYRLEGDMALNVTFKPQA